MPWNEVQIAKLRRRIEPKPFWRSEKKFRDGEGDVVIRGLVGHVMTLFQTDKSGVRRVALGIDLRGSIVLDRGG